MIPDYEVTNADRARWANAAVCAFALKVAADPVGQMQCDPETMLVDLLADLNHWADERRINFHHALKKAGEHYAIESHGGEGNYQRELRVKNFDAKDHVMMSERMRHTLRDRMYETRVDQKSLASLAGIAPSTLNRWVKGTAKFVLRANWKRAMEALEAASRRVTQPKIEWGNPPEGA